MPATRPVSSRPAPRSQPATSPTRTTRTYSRAVAPVPSAPAAPQVAYDPGYAAVGLQAPVIVNAKPSWSRPGVVTAACVLSFVFAAFAMFASMGWFAAGDWTNDADDMMRGFANVGIAILLTVGGVLAMTRQDVGRYLTIAGAAGLAVYAVFQIVGGWYNNIFDAFAAVLVVALLLTTPANRYYATKAPLGHD